MSMLQLMKALFPRPKSLFLTQSCAILAHATQNTCSYLLGGGKYARRRATADWTV
jgi:hypothetical protein